MDIKLSIIVPVYNASRTLSRCIESLQRQTLLPLEIILVNDGSTDKSGVICDDYAEYDERIKVIHQDNQGPLLARLSGIKHSKGEYISFVDSDDWVEREMFKELYSEMEGVDMLISGLNHNAADGRFMGATLNALKAGVYDLSNMSIRNELFFPGTYVSGECPLALFWGPVGKIYRREIVLGFVGLLNFRIREYEDWLFNVLYMLRCKKIRVSDKCYYHVCTTANSITHSSNMNFLSEQNKIYKILKQEIEKYSAKDGLMKQIQKMFMYNIISDIGMKMEFEDEVLIPKWHFKRSDMLIGKRIVLFGAGKVGKSYLMDLRKRKIDVVLWIDNVPKSCELFGMMPISPNVINNVDFDYVVCGVKGRTAYEAMRDQLLNLGINSQKILWEEPVYTWIEYFAS